MHLKFLLCICLAIIRCNFRRTNLMHGEGRQVVQAVVIDSSKTRLMRFVKNIFSQIFALFNFIPFSETRSLLGFFTTTRHALALRYNLFALLLWQTLQFYAVRPYSFSSYLHRQKLTTFKILLQSYGYYSFLSLFFFLYILSTGLEVRPVGKYFPDDSKMVRGCKASDLFEAEGKYFFCSDRQKW